MMRRLVDRARAKRAHRAALKRAKRLKVAREHPDGLGFRKRLAAKVGLPLEKAIPGTRAAAANTMFVAGGSHPPARRAPRLRAVTAPGWLVAVAYEPKTGIAKAVRAFAGDPS